VPVQANTPLKEGDALFHALGAAFQQNSLQRVKTGDEAESPSGHVSKGNVRVVLGAIAAGQIQATGALVASAPARKGQLRWATKQRG
jgi:hypothetical protein